LRTYQLLLSPSIMSYVIHDQFYNYKGEEKNPFAFLPKSLQMKLYSLSIREFDMDFMFFNYLWTPLKKVGVFFTFLQNKTTQALLLILSFASVYILTLEVAEVYHYYIACGFILIALIAILVAWVERGSAMRAWTFIGFGQLYFMIAMSELSGIHIGKMEMFLSGLIGAYIGGIIVLKYISTKENNVSLDLFHGHIYEHKWSGLFFLICCLSMVGFPISPSFMGMELMFDSIGSHHYFILGVGVLLFILLEIAVIRIYARIFLGPHVKNYHEIAYRSA
jgi:NADH-quinone oxidoreductase subunit L